MKFTGLMKIRDFKGKNCGDLLNLILLGLVVFTVFISEISLYLFSDGLMLVLSHIFYFPLIFLIFQYPAKGLRISFSLAAFYIFTNLIIYVLAGSPGEMIFYSGILFVFTYVCIGTVTTVIAQGLHQKEDDLKEIQKRYLNIFENSGDGVIVHRMDGKILMCNPAARKMFEIEGSIDEELDFKDLKIEGDCKLMRKALAEVMRDGHGFYETEIKIKSGKVITAEISASMADSEKGIMHVFIRDTTGKMNALNALRESENRLKSLTNQLPEVIFEMDSNGKFTFATRYSTNMFGYSPEELEGGMLFQGILSEEERERATKNIHWFLTGHIIGAVEYNAKRKDGSVFPLMVHFGYIFNGGEISGLRGIAIDISQRKHMEKALRRNEKKYRSLFENSNDAVIIHDFNGRIIDINDSLVKILGYKKDELLNIELSAVYPGSEYNALKDALSNLKESGNYFYETKLKTRSGNEVFVEISASIVSKSKGIVQSIIRDITERKISESALIESERRFRNLTDLLPQIVFEIDNGGMITFLNKNGFDSGIISPEQFKEGFNIYSLIDEPDRSRARENFEWMISGYRSERGYEYSVIKTNGTKIPFLIYTSPIEKNGKTEGARGIAIDISSRKRMEEAFIVSEERLNLAIEGAGVCVWDWDMVNDEMFFSGNYQEMFCYSEEGCYKGSDNWKDILQVKFFRDIMDFFNDVVDVEQRVIDKESRHFESEYHILCGDGRYKWINVMGKISDTDSGGIPLRIVGIMQDINEIKQYQNSLYEANRKLNLLSSITRHDILNQVAGIKGFTDLMDKKVRDNDELTHHLKRIRQASENIKEQIEFTRDYHNVGVEVPRWQRVDNIALRIKGMARSSGVTIDVKCGPLEVYADPMLEKIFFNLFDNAVRHGEKVTMMSLDFVKSNDYGVIVVMDNGLGVPDKLKEKIFDHGFGSNTGLGLFLTKEILGITGMKIHETGVYGEGARFEIEIPYEGYRFSE
ncbi:PAS domain S-box protein [Methanoplanus sp. FWC-SCC4]|uniref:histidine kinase n=1 Tax=Methanochimaera problematica TaxID=2609417 RepID=A0AA97FEQ8_9EURY|nr:PAS domain S-box protein [Methanoplanus sp. FWC-SCC4]WOF16688.1 PAS domain S-box protein [Methanoplanus sp. FWC-SCC4]